MGVARIQFIVLTIRVYKTLALQRSDSSDISQVFLNVAMLHWQAPPVTTSN